MVNTRTQGVRDSWGVYDDLITGIIRQGYNTLVQIPVERGKDGCSACIPAIRLSNHHPENIGISTA